MAHAIKRMSEIIYKLKTERINIHTIHSHPHPHPYSLPSGISLVLGYLVCWTPYAVVAFWNSFFDPNALPVVLHCFPPLFAKASAALEPILFIVSNHRYKMALFELMMCGKDDIIADASRERERSKAQVS